MSGGQALGGTQQEGEIRCFRSKEIASYFGLLIWRLDLLAAILDASPTDDTSCRTFQFVRKGALNSRCIQGSPAIADLNVSTPLSKCAISYFSLLFTFVVFHHIP